MVGANGDKMYANQKKPSVLGLLAGVAVLTMITSSALAADKTMAFTPWDRSGAKGPILKYVARSNVSRLTNPHGSARALYGQVIRTYVSKKGVPTYWFAPHENAQGNPGYGGAFGPNRFVLPPHMNNKTRVRVITGKDLSLKTLTVRPGELLGFPVTQQDAMVLTADRTSIRIQDVPLGYIGQTGPLVKTGVGANRRLALFTVEDHAQPGSEINIRVDDGKFRSGHSYHNLTWRLKLEVK